MSAGVKPQYNRLWPTLFMALELPGSESANPVLAGLLLDQESRSEDLTVRYLEQDLFAWQHPAVGWLRQCCEKAVLDYAVEAGLDYRPDIDLQAWVNINRRGDYHNLHNHPHSWLSGTYYVQVPERPREMRTRSDLNPGAISFFDPRPQANMLAIKGDPQVDPEYRLLPRPGMLLLWPAFVHHLVHPNLSDEQRISVSFNVVLRWRDSYLP